MRLLQNTPMSDCTPLQPRGVTFAAKLLLFTLNSGLILTATYINLIPQPFFSILCLAPSTNTIIIPDITHGDIRRQHFANI